MARFIRDFEALTASFFAAEATSFIDRIDIEELDRLSKVESGSVRLSTHQSPASGLHSMMILQPHGTYAPPRKHRTRSKIFHIVQGEMVVATFNESGSIRDAYHLALDRVVVVHIEPDCYHTNMALTSHAVYHEVISGPFERTSPDRVFASFAPSATEQDEGLAFVIASLATVLPDTPDKQSPRT